LTPKLPRLLDKKKTYQLGFKNGGIKTNSTACTTVQKLLFNDHTVGVINTGESCSQIYGLIQLIFIDLL